MSKKLKQLCYLLAVNTFVKFLKSTLKMFKELQAIKNNQKFLETRVKNQKENEQKVLEAREKMHSLRIAKQELVR